MRIWTILLVSILGGCATAGLPALPSKGGPAWREISTDHLVVWTDLPPERARETADTLEGFFTLVVSGVLEHQGPMGGARPLVLAVRDVDDWQYFGHLPKGSFHFEADVPAPDGVFPQSLLAFVAGDAFREKLLQPLGAVSTRSRLARLATLAVAPAAPTWFVDGTASYLGDARFDAAEFRYGSKPYVADVGKVSERSDVIQIEQSARPRPEMWQFWIVSYLIATHPEPFRAYRRALVAAGQADWKTFFPDLPEDKLQEKVEAWLKTGSATEQRFRPPARAAAPAERALADADVLAARALLHLMLTADRDLRMKRIRVNVDQALAADPTQPVAALLARHLDPARVDAAKARAVAAAHPDSPFAALLLAEAAEGAEKEEAFARLCRVAGPRLVELKSGKACK